jgi:hypothetical protein
MVLELNSGLPTAEAKALESAASPSPVTQPITTLRLKNLLDRRREARYPTSDPAVVEILHGSNTELPALVLDVSRSGLRLQLKTAIARGALVKITLVQQSVIYGEVRYCRRAVQEYHIGILVKDLFDLRLPLDEHLSEDDLGFYVVGKGLTVSEVITIKNHLVQCEACRVRLGELHSILNPVRRRKALA